MTRWFLGVDIGSSKSHALISDEHGNVAGAGIGGPGNHESVGREGFQRVLAEITTMALESAGITRSDIAAAGFGVAGYDWDEDTAMMQDVIATLELHAPYEAQNDAGPGLLAVSSSGWGVSITAGTSVNGRGRDAQGRQARLTGNGLVFAEVGGGGELVYRAINDIARAWTKRGPETILTEKFVRYVNARDIEDLLAGIARKRYRIGASAAPLVFQAADEDDKVALNAVRWIGTGLGDLACGIIRQLGIEQLAFDVVLSGSLVQGSPLIMETTRKVVHQLAPAAQIVHLQAPPVTGAVMLAMEQVGIDFLPFRERIIASGRRLLNAGEQG